MIIKFTRKSNHPGHCLITGRFGQSRCMVEWLAMLFNVEKCKVVNIGYNNTYHGYSLRGSKLESMREEKDLWILISNDLKWEKQYSQAVAKANKLLGLIKRNLTDRSKETIISLYNLWLGLTHLEYWCPIWNPHYIKDIKLVEGVQRRATKLVYMGDGKI